MRLSEKLLPKKEILDKLTYKAQKKVSVLITGDIICCIMFFMFALGLIGIGHAITGTAMLCMCLIFTLSIVLTKKGKMILGSYTTSIGLCVACFIVAFLTSHVDHPLVSYRTVCFCVAIACLNYMISLKKGQLFMFMGLSVVLLISSTFILHYPEEFMQCPKDWVSGIVINLMAIICSNSLLIASNKSNDQIVSHSEKEHEQANESLGTITNVLNQFREAMNVGQKLNGAAVAATDSVNSIQEVYQTLLDETQNLDEQTGSIKESSQVVNQQSSIMSNSILKQNNSISEISSAITEISSNISQIDGIGEKRRVGMAEVTKLLESQNSLIKKIVENMNKVQESSLRVTEFVSTVDKIAQQTNLLAMNASIEAAHSGEHGKGFSVIAQEIRKLSEETTANAKRISETLENNNIVVTETAESIAMFAKATEKSEVEIHETFDSMEEILHGIREMDIGTREIMTSVNKVVEVSEENAKVIEEVVNQIEKQGYGIDNITNATSSLKERVASISEMLPRISGAIDEVQKSAQENEEVSGRIAEILK